MLTLSDEEVKELHRFFMSCGYICYENHSQTHAIARKVDEHINGKRSFTPIGKDEGNSSKDQSKGNAISDFTD